MKPKEVLLPDDAVVQRRRFLQTSLLTGVSAAVLPALAGARVVSPPSPAAPGVSPSELDELTIADLQQGMTSGKFTARSLVEKYLARIESLDKQDPTVNSVIQVNPDALSIADALDL